MERVFDLDEANSLLPVLRDLLTRLQETHGELLADGRRIVFGNGSGSAAQALSAAEKRYAQLLREIGGRGVIVRDPESGLIDFPADRDGQPVYLCWRLGEEGIAFWHPRDTGVAGRQPL